MGSLIQLPECHNYTPAPTEEGEEHLRSSAAPHLLATRRAGWVAAGVLAFLLIVSHGDHIKGRLGAAGASKCVDPFVAPHGYIWRGDKDVAEDIRWIPLSPLLLANTSTPALSNLLSPPSSALDWYAAPTFNRLLQEPSPGTNPALSFARNKTVVFVGDSHDRSNIVGFCQQHEAAGSVLTIPHFHIKASCQIPDLGLTVASWFHYGLAEEKEDAWYIPEQPGGFVDNPGPTSIEARLTNLFLPDVAVIGSPDLLILNSFFWDLRFFALHARHYGRASLEAEERPLTEAFPKAKIMFRLGQEHATNRNGGNVGVFQLNSSIRAILAHLGVPVFEWASLLSGEDQYKDDQHLKTGKPAFLFGSMLLWYLRRVVEGWDSC